MFESGVVESPVGAELAVVLDTLDLSSLDGGERVDALCAVGRHVAHAQALLLTAMAAVAETSVGIGFDSDEVAFALHLPRMCARREVALAQDLRDRLPQVLEALSLGRICLARARVFSDTLMPVADDGVARRIAYRLLPSAQQWTASQLRQRLLKEIVIADPQAAKARVERSVADRRVSLVSNDDTTACLSAIFLPPAKAAAAFERVDAIAGGMKHDGDTRTLDQLRADVFCDLLAGVSPTSAPVLRAGVVELLVPLSTLTGQSDSPGHLAGYGPVIADIARQVAVAQAAQAGRAAQAGQTTQADQAAADAAQTAASAQAAGGVVAPQPPTRWRYRVHDEDGMLLYHGTTRARPEPDVSQDGPDVSQDGPDVSQDSPGVSQDSAAHSDARGCVDREAEIPRVMPCHADSVAPGVVRIRPLTPHPPAQADPAARFPNARMRDWIAARDSTCRAPGCTAPARSCDIDHTDDHAAGGATRDDNLGLLCRHHHRLKHEGGHRLDQPRPGHFRWTSPNGRTYDVPPDPP